MATLSVSREWIDLSSAQQAVWLDANLTGSSDYQLGRWARFTGDIDVELMRQAVSLIMARHDAFRLRVDDELPRQWLDASVNPPLTVIDLSHEPDPDVAFHRHMAQTFATPMPLGDHPLFRVELIQTGPTDWYFLLRFHHLIADSAAVAIALHHWAEAYGALTGETSQELAPPSSYVATIAADRAYLDSARYQQDLAYWVARFEPLPPPLLPDLGLPMSLEQPHAEPAEWTLDGDAYAKFASAVEAVGANTPRAVFALLLMVLARRHGQTDVVAGLALHRRDLSNRNVVGMLAGVIPVRLEIEWRASLREIVKGLSVQIDEDLRHQRMPIDALSRAIGLSGSGRSGMFEVAMSYMPAVREQSDGALDHLTVGTVQTQEASPISFHVADLVSGPGLSLHISVNPRFLDPSEAQKLQALLQEAIVAFVIAPRSSVEDLLAVTLAEREQVVEQWNRTEALYPVGTLPLLFEAQAAKTPDAGAVVCGDEALTYAQLNARANALAHRLITEGVAPERVVGVALERSEWAVIALLAVMKAGGVYLPLDVTYPDERLAYMIEGAGAVLVLTQTDTVDRLPSHLNRLLLDNPSTVADQSEDNPTASQRGGLATENLAYIIYTSGTTGRPKGVGVPHRAAVNLAYARQVHDPLGVGDRVLAAISVGFDVSVGQLALPLLCGATVVVIGEVRTLSASEYWDTLVRQGVTHVNSVPSFFESVLDAAPAGFGLRRLMLGGEALSGALANRISAGLSGTPVVNMYGPTEACIDATCHPATQADASLPVLPIGRPLGNYRAYILDSRLDPVGVGVSGELYLGGAGLARGYVGQPGLTAERFVADPFGDTSGTPGGRLYKTGDRARWRGDGEIEFLGRADTQVKIRGFRVEPGEIASALLTHGSVSQAVVLARADRRGVVRLVAYLVGQPGQPESDAGVLRAHLSHRLPEYMIPAAFRTLDALPLTPNGKLDQQALPPVDFMASDQYIAPRTSTENAVSEMFADLLGLERVGVTDDFFALGGHSLLATRLVSQIHHALGVTIPLRAVFETPSVESLARRIESAPPGQSLAHGISAPPERPRELPLSFPQERLWFLAQMQQDDTYNIPFAVMLHGDLDVRALERSLARIVERHEALRTRIVLRDGQPRQEIHPAGEFTVRHADLSALPSLSQDEALHGHLRELARRRFDLAAAPPFEILLITLGPAEHVLAAVVHHVSFDGWSAGVFFGEFAALYDAFAGGLPDPLPPLVWQYPDFALRQRGQDTATDLDYWCGELAGAPSLSALPHDHMVTDDGARPAAVVPLRFEPALQEALSRCARANGASLFMVLHTALALLLSRWTEQKDVIIGTVVANRTLTEFEPLIGCFVNTLPLRTRLQPDESLEHLLGRVRESDLAAYAHQNLAFERLVEALQPDRSLQHTPLFQIMLVLQNAPLPTATLPGLTIEPLSIDPERAKFDLTLSLGESVDAELTGSLEYAADRFSPQTMSRFVAQYRRLLEAFAAAPDQSALGVDLLAPSEREQILDTWNRTEAVYPTGTLPSLFEEQAAKTPAAVAVVCGDVSLTYAQLNARANVLAHRLIAEGVGPERVVGVALERSEQTVIALLAIMKAGGVYLPLDVTYPDERLAYMVQDAGAALVITQAAVADRLPGNATCLFLDDDATLAGQSEANPSEGQRDHLTAGNLAYIIYTSGTTGRPKGVGVPHRAAVNLAYARQVHDPLGVGDRVLAAISVGFDVSVGQLALPLLCGATVIVIGEVRTLSGSEYWDTLVRQGVTHVNSVPSFFESVLDAAPSGFGLRRLMLGGEALSGALATRISAGLSGTLVVNMYGPTEACIDATCHPATQADASLPVLPIGRPLGNYRAYILDSRLDPVGVGVSGELYLGGAGLARGYVGQPGLTAERFVADPFGPAGGRLYGTGDRARWRADGQIEFLGRADTQVKVRGHRIELGEIEAQLVRLGGVREAAVLALGETAGDARLVAYYTGESVLPVEVLRSHLSSSLPEYMVPSSYVHLDALPLTANGKLDRAALPVPELHAYDARDYVPPVGPVEETVARVWSELLGVGRVGRLDNFFELGGHSLLVIALIEKLRQEGLHADVRTLFSSPSVAALAETLGQHSASVSVPANGIVLGAETITPAMLPLASLSQGQINGIVACIPGGAANVQDLYPLAPLQEGILFQHLLVETGDPYLSPFVIGFDTRERLDGFLLALNRLIARHDILRTAFVWEGLDEPVQVVLRQAELSVEEISLDPDAGDAVEQLLYRFDPRRYRLDLRQAPLMRAVVARDEAHSRFVLLLMTHHLVLDHTSMEIAVREINALTQGQEHLLPAPLPYRNFVAQARLGVPQEEHRAFFTEMLGDVTEPTAPYGLLDVQGDGSDVAEARLPLPAEVAQRLRVRARSLGVSAASVFHLAWALVLGQVSGRRDVVFGTTLLGRMQSGEGAGGVLGMFINTLPLRLDLKKPGDVEGAVRDTHQRLADLLGHEHAPLSLAQRCSRVSPPTPLFSSLFNYRYSVNDTEAGAAEWPGVEFLYATERTNYPLALAVDDLGTGFLLTTLAQAPIDADRVNDYMASAVTGLVDALEQKPQAELSTLEALPASERHWVVEEWNRTEAVYPVGTLSSLFEAQVAKTPDAVAVVCNDISLTYDQLNGRADAIAHQLLAEGVGSERVVGVALERSERTVVALLAVMKAGGIYLPLDITYPDDRLAYMIEDAGAALVITQASVADRLPAGLKSLLLDQEATVADQSEVNPTASQRGHLTAENLAYIIYTSGTTGRPKGVGVPHKAAVNLAYARQTHDPLGVGDRVLAAISVGFDVSVGQLALPLLCGATVVVIGEARALSGSEYWGTLVRQGVTHVNSVPSFFESVLDAAPAGFGLRRLMLGGEALSGALASRISAGLSGTPVVNMYGPTEACIDATCHPATDADILLPVLPIGRPLGNYRAYILDARLDPVGVGMSGELYLGGAGLARGYVGQPGLTAERFVADPFGDASGTPGGRLYRTGDRARWRGDGQIEFLGRADTQVKVRGHRIELGEIETQLAKLGGVREAAVLALGETAGDARLVAYYTGESVLPVEALRSHLLSSLPEYMVPSAYVRLDALPLTANGKLDRASLPVPEVQASVREYSPPVGPVEETVARIWSELLGVERVGRLDNFFELGGHSLLVIALIEKLRQEGLYADVRSLFSAPSVAALAETLGVSSTSVSVPANGIVSGSASITPDMLPLASLSQGQIDGIVRGVPGGAANVQDVYPLAPLQEGILFQHLLVETGDPYLSPFVLGFDTRQRLDGFLLALNRLIARHDILRTGFVWEGLDEPVQVVLRQADLQVEEMTLPTASVEDSSVVEQLLSRFDPRRYRLDLRRAPLMRAAVARDEVHDRFVLLLMTHHLVLDHTSMEIAVREIRALTQGLEAHLLPSPLPYRNFVAQARLGVSAEDHRAFFSGMLGDVAEPTAPYGLLDVQGDGSGVTERRLMLEPQVAGRLRVHARSLGVSAASVFHLAWALVLGQVSGRRDVVFGTTLLGRMQSGEGAGGVLGMFINTLPIRLNLDRMAGIAEAVRDTHQRLADLLGHEHAPLSLAQRCSRVQSPTPLFSALFNYRYSTQDPEAGPMEWPGVEFLYATERTNYPLALAVDDLGTGFLLTTLAQTPIDADRVNAYMASAITGLVDALEHAPQAELAALQVLPLAEREQVVEEWNRTEAVYPTGTLPSLFEAQTAKTPDAVAVVCGDVSLTYAQLNAQANRLAHRLIAEGVGPERVVGVALERSEQTVIALLAVMKAGGVYLPLDVTYPDERLAYMTEDAGAALVLTQAAVAERLPENASCLFLDDDATVAGQSEDNPTAAQRGDLTAGNLAYIIYTSGTTGRPKGVGVPHRAAVNLAFARQVHDPLGVGDRVLAAISVGFDVSVGQLALPLLCGATVVVIGEVRTLSASEYWGTLVRQGVTHVNSVPSFFESVLDAAPAGFGLRRLMLGGEALSGALASRISAGLSGTPVVNMYGPTEACIDATCYPAGAEDQSSAVLPIGRPLGNYRAYILDSRLDPVGVGVSGELYLGGAGLARGYVGQAGLTAERFVADPFGPAGGRLYRTGDRARWRADGQIEFLGRADTQVKIRGFRVEPGEIASALLTHGSVGQAVVLARSDRRGVVRLVAYLVGQPSQPDPDPAILRAHLSHRLPEYMIPAAFRTLDALPLTSNGKLDTSALPMDEERDSAVEYEPPSNPTELKLQKIWEHLLGVESIGVRDDFFQLGGDSLTAIRLVTICNREFKSHLRVRSLFEDPTIRALALAVRLTGEAGNESHLVPLQTQGSKPALFCIHPAGGHVLCYLPLVRQLGNHQPVFGLQARGVEDDLPPASSIEEMAADYIQAIKRVQPEGPYQLLGMSSGGLIAYEMAQQLQKQGDQISALVMLDTTVPDAISEEVFDDSMLVRAMASELGCDDLLDGAPHSLTLAELVEMARRVNRLPEDFSLVQAERIAGVFRSTVDLHSRYRPAEWSGPLLLVRALRRLRTGGQPPDWSAYLTGSHTQTDIECEHNELVSSAFAPTIARYVAPLLASSPQL